MAMDGRPTERRDGKAARITIHGCEDITSIDDDGEPRADSLSLTDQTRRDAIEQLTALYAEHVHDFNFPQGMLQRAAALIHHDTGADGFEQASALLLEFHAQKQLMLNDSPYPEVRAVVEPKDDADLPVNTFRAWTLGTVFTILGTATNQFFSLRYPSITVLSYVAQLLSYPCGVFMAKTLPTKTFHLARFSFSLNPGPFSQKEHIVVTIMSNVAYGGANKFAYATIVIQLLKLPMFFNEAVLADSLTWQILLVLSTQLLGFGAAGITRKILVYPAEMIWPSCLAQIALNKALHQDDGQNLPVSGWTVSRNRFFLYAFTAMFLYFWFPNYLFTALSSFNWMTWISPGNVTLAVITGSICGLGINPISTFDWNQATVLLDPIITPFFSTANQFAGMLIAVVAVVIPIYWTNWLDVAYLPPNSNILFDKTGQIYNVSKILSADFTLDEKAYQEQGIPYQSATWVVGYVAYFAVYLACLTHVALYNRRELSKALHGIFKPRGTKFAIADADIHYRLIKAYKEVPDWWFLALLILSFTLACICSLAWNTTMPVWGLFFALGLCFVFQIPAGVILAVSNVAVELNVLADIIGGAALVGKPIANLMFKAYGALACAQSIQFSADLKLAYYCKVPPRVTFACQIWATVVAAFVSVAVNQWQMTNIRDVCAVDQPDKFICPTTRSVFTSSVLLGVIGPRRLFGPGKPYNSLVWGFLAGAVMPVPFYLLSKKFPNSWVRYVHVPAALNGTMNLSPYNLTHMWPPFCISLLINYFVKSRMMGWWQKYAYVLACAFSSGLAISAIVMFFAFQLKQIDIDWWGNTVSYAGVDGGQNPVACVLKNRSA